MKKLVIILSFVLFFGTAVYGQLAIEFKPFTTEKRDALLSEMNTMEDYLGPGMPDMVFPYPGNSVEDKDCISYIFLSQFAKKVSNAGINLATSGGVEKRRVGVILYCNASGALDKVAYWFNPAIKDSERSKINQIANDLAAEFKTSFKPKRNFSESTHLTFVDKK